MRSVVHSLLILAFLAATPALAQQEPPARVGRVAFVAGAARLSRERRDRLVEGVVELSGRDRRGVLDRSQIARRIAHRQPLDRDVRQY